MNRYTSIKLAQAFSAALLVFQTAQKPWQLETYVYAALGAAIAWLSPSNFGVQRKKQPAKE